jgi:hypothetical protein
MMPNTKGTNVVELVRFLRSRRDQARELLPPELQHYLEDRIEVTRWYPEEDSLGLQRAVAALLPVAEEDAYELMGSLDAQLHLKGVYRHLRENARTEVLPVRIAALWASVHDTGKVRFAQARPGSSQIDLVDFEATSIEVCRSATGYIREVYRMAGVENLNVRKTACRLSGDDLCSWSVTWDPEDR